MATADDVPEDGKPYLRKDGEWYDADNRYYTETETDTLLAAKANTADLGELADHDTVDYRTEVTNKPTLGALADHDTVNYDTEVTNKPSTFPPAAHNHDDRYYTETETDTLLAGKANTSHNHDDRYYTESETNTLLANKADAVHDHDSRYYTKAETDSRLGDKQDTLTFDDVPTSGSSNPVKSGGVYSALSEKANRSELGALAAKNQADWTTDITNIPQTFPPSAHNHDGVYLPLHGTADLAGAVTPIALTNEDLNDLQPENTTWYYTASNSSDITNKPYTSTEAFSLVVYRTASLTRYQILTRVDGIIYSRYYRRAEWSAWVQWDPANAATRAMLTQSVEGSTTATRSYNTGDLVIVGSQLLRATTGIGIDNAIIVGTNAVVVDLETVIKEKAEKIATFPMVNNAGSHNSIYRGAALGNSVTSAQWSAISAGTFEDLFIGDYWTINNVNWRIAAFDYWYGMGDSACARMNSTAITTGAYVGSDFYTGANDNTTKATCQTAITGAFGSAHILTHKEYLANAVDTNGAESDGAWYNSTFEVMSEVMIFGTEYFHNKLTTGRIPKNNTVSNTQLPLFRLDRNRILSGGILRLRDVVSSMAFSVVAGNGYSAFSNANNSGYFRPAFGICA